MIAEFYSPSMLSELARPLAGGGWLYDFAELGLSVAALNSCEKETHRPAERVGFVSREQAQSLLELWSNAAEGSGSLPSTIRRLGWSWPMWTIGQRKQRA